MPGNNLREVVKCRVCGCGCHPDNLVGGVCPVCMPKSTFRERFREC